MNNMASNKCRSWGQIAQALLKVLSNANGYQLLSIFNNENLTHNGLDEGFFLRAVEEFTVLNVARWGSRYKLS